MKSFVICASIAALLLAPAAAQESPPAVIAVALDDGGFSVEKPANLSFAPAAGLFAAPDLDGLVKETTAANRTARYEPGAAIPGVFEITIGRDDGALVRYSDVSDVTIFPKPKSMREDGGLTTLVGAVVFSLKIDNTAEGAAAPRRLEHGVIMLTRTDDPL